VDVENALAEALVGILRSPVERERDSADEQDRGRRRNGDGLVIP
jgi:hypothetical protein